LHSEPSQTPFEDTFKSDNGGRDAIPEPNPIAEQTGFEQTNLDGNEDVPLPLPPSPVVENVATPHLVDAISSTGPPPTTPAEQQRPQYQHPQANQQQHPDSLNSSGNKQNAPLPGKNAPQRRAQPPAEKLQAKITGLERTGKKDLILRFDVHVCV